MLEEIPSPLKNKIYHTKIRITNFSFHSEEEDFAKVKTPQKNEQNNDVRKFLKGKRDKTHA